MLLVSTVVLEKNRYSWNKCSSCPSWFIVLRCRVVFHWSLSRNNSTILLILDRPSRIYAEPRLVDNRRGIHPLPLGLRVHRKDWSVLLRVVFSWRCNERRSRHYVSAGRSPCADRVLYLQHQDAMNRPEFYVMHRIVVEVRVRTRYLLFYLMNTPSTDRRYFVGTSERNAWHRTVRATWNGPLKRHWRCATIEDEEEAVGWDRNDRNGSYPFEVRIHPSFLNRDKP